MYEISEFLKFMKIKIFKTQNIFSFYFLRNIILSKTKILINYNFLNSLNLNL